MTTFAEVQGWSCGLDAVARRIGPRFARAEPRRRVGAYLRGLLAPVERKNGWQLAAAVGDATPDGVQDFLSRMRWDADAVRDDLQAYVAEHLGDADGVLVLDETGFLKKGTGSAGVQPQYTGTAGRVANAQVGVFLGYAGRHGCALVDRALYLPEGWARDADRRAAVHVPEAVAFTTKPKLGLRMLERARVAGMAFAWVVGDSVYGADSAIRAWAQRHRRSYVLGVTSAQRFGARTVASLARELPEHTWQRLSAGAGTKGGRVYDWACLPHKGAAPGFGCALLVRRSIHQPGELSFHLTHAAHGTTVAELARVAGARWSIESLFQQAKGEVGLDHYEVRSWVGWHRHVTLAMFALAFLAAVRRTAEPNAKPGAIGGSGPGQPAPGPSAAHHARGQATDRGPGQPATTRARRRPALVGMATTPPATRQARPLEPTNTTTKR